MRLYIEVFIHEKIAAFESCLPQTIHIRIGWLKSPIHIKPINKSLSS